MLFEGQKTHEDEDILKAQDFIEKNYMEKITVDQLADMLSIGRRSFERRFKKATNNTVVEYLQRVKIEAAKRSFESSRKNINEVMFNVGYTDTKAFRTIFKKITGLTPIEYRNKYNKQAVVACSQKAKVKSKKMTVEVEQSFQSNCFFMTQVVILSKINNPSFELFN